MLFAQDRTNNDKGALVVDYLRRKFGWQISDCSTIVPEYINRRKYISPEARSGSKAECPENRGYALTVVSYVILSLDLEIEKLVRRSWKLEKNENVNS